MRRFLIAAVVTALALVPALAAAHGNTKISVIGEARAGGVITIAGTGFAPGDVVRIELRKEDVDPIELVRAPVDADGAITTTLRLPASVMPGIYTMAADGKDSATTEVIVLAALNGSSATAPEPPSATNNRPRAETAALAAVTALVALAGLGLLWLSRRHPRPGGAV